MDLRSELDAAYRRIAQLEKELEGYRKPTARRQSSPSLNCSATHTRTKVITRSASAALASQQTNSESDRNHSSGTRPRCTSMPRKIEPKSTVTPSGPLHHRDNYHASEANQSNNELNTTESDSHLANISKHGQKHIQPAPIVCSQRFVPLQLKLPSNGLASSASRSQIAAKIATMNMFSASSSLSDVQSPPSPTISTNSKKVVPLQKQSASKRHSSLQAGISKSTRKERSGLVAKCTEPRPGQTRYWTEEEHERFLEAVAQYGEKAYVAISNFVETRTPKQVRTHAQKFQMKVARMARERSEAGEIMELPPGMLPSSIGIDPSKVICTPPLNATPTQVEAAARAASENEARRQAMRLEAEQAARARAQAQIQAQAQTQTQTQGQTEAVVQMSDSGADSSTEMRELVAEAVSSVSDVTSDELADPYLNYIGGEGVQDEVNEFEQCFAARLPKTWSAGEVEIEEKQKLPALSVAAALMDSTSKEDDLEDLEECGDLTMASLVNFGI